MRQDIQLSFARTSHPGRYMLAQFYLKECSPAILEHILALPHLLFITAMGYDLSKEDQPPPYAGIASALPPTPSQHTSL